MSLVVLRPGERLPCPAGVAVVIPVFGAHDLFVRCLSSAIRNTPQDVPILVADDASPEPASQEWVRRLDQEGRLQHEVAWLRQPENLGFVGNCNAAFAATAPADVVLLNSDCVVSEGWLDGLRAAAESDSTIATATALTNHGSIVSVPHRNRAVPMLPQERELDDHARAVREASPRLRPRLPVAVGHCVLIRRAALDLVGGFDEAFAPAYGEEVDFSQRCVLRGMQHVLADDVLVFHHGGGSLDIEGRRNPLQAQHEALIRNRYKFYESLVRDVERDEHSALARTLRVASQAIRGLSVTIDARCLTRFITGTQLHTLELIGALWRTRAAQLRIIVPPDLGEYARATMAEMPGLQIVPIEEALEPTDVVHRPYQVSSAGDLELLHRCGHRVLITAQDLIAYRNPSYFPSAASWLEHRRLTAESMAFADLVVFFSRHAAEDALAEDLMPEGRARTVYIGVDHRLGSLKPAPAPPRGAEALGDRPVLLCLGTRFVHKNRLFALRLLAALRARGWDGALVLAGPDVLHGSSNGEEAAFLAAHPELGEALHGFGAVDEAEKAWLYERCTAVVYPTTYEGFGLVPFEAADVGRPCFFAPVASLAEVLPEETALLRPWDADASADAVLPVLQGEQARRDLVEAISCAGERFTWERTAQELLGVYHDALRAPARDLRRLRGELLIADHRYWGFRDAIGPTGMSLVEPGTGLLDEEAQRALAALVRRPATRRPVLTTLRAVHRAATGRRPDDTKGAA